jgi:hypothetical protein
MLYQYYISQLRYYNVCIAKSHKYNSSLVFSNNTNEDVGLEQLKFEFKDIEHLAPVTNLSLARIKSSGISGATIAQLLHAEAEGWKPPYIHRLKAKVVQMFKKQ